MIEMAARLAEEIARVFRPWDIGLLLFTSLSIVLIVGTLLILWYSYTSRYVYENI